MEFAAPTAWAAGLVFARVTAIIMLIPGIGDTAVPPRVRLAFCFLIALVLAPVVSKAVPAIPPTMAAGALILIGEIAVGLAIGAATRILYSSLATAGAIAGIQTGLSFAMLADPSQGSQGAIFGAFLAVLGTALIFATGLHHWFFMAAASSYDKFPVGGTLALESLVQFGIRAFSDAFSIALQITAPLIVFGLAINVAVGLVNKLAPAVQLFFIVQSAQVLFGLVVFMITAGAGMLVWLDRMDTAARALN
jgi:flagellar biosynthetic protein FliR